MSKLVIRDLYINPQKPNDPEKWEPAELDIEVNAGDYRVIRSKVGKYLIYTVKYDMVEDIEFKENPDSPPPGANDPKPKRWSKMYRCWFDLNYKKDVSDPNKKPISHEEKVEYPELLPEKISKEPEPEGKVWPKDPFYRLYKNYKYTDPTKPQDTKECDVKYLGEPHVFIQKLVTSLTKIDVEQYILPEGETPPPPVPQGQEEPAEQAAKRLKNFIIKNDIKGTLKAEYEILSVKEVLNEDDGKTNCNILKTEKKKISFRKVVNVQEGEEEPEVVLVDLPIVRF